MTAITINQSINSDSLPNCVESIILFDFHRLWLWWHILLIIWTYRIQHVHSNLSCACTNRLLYGSGPSVCPDNLILKNKQVCWKTELGVNVPQGKSNRCADFQLKCTSDMKNPQKIEHILHKCSPMAHNTISLPMARAAMWKWTFNLNHKFASAVHS